MTQRTSVPACVDYDDDNMPIRGLHDSVLIDTLIAKGVDVSAVYDGVTISFARKIALNADKNKVVLA